jgi:cobalamin biosynthesis Co2+ chelatase CbiK
MKAKHLKEWINEMEEEYMECDVYFHEVGYVNDKKDVFVKHTPINEVGIRIAHEDKPTVLVLGQRLRLEEKE